MVSTFKYTVASGSGLGHHIDVVVNTKKVSNDV